MLLQVHDQLVFEVPEDEVEPTADLIRDVMMMRAAHLDVPLVVDLGWGRDWDAAHLSMVGAYPPLAGHRRAPWRIRSTSTWLVAASAKSTIL
jgi:hypothetical protein